MSYRRLSRENELYATALALLQSEDPIMASPKRTDFSHIIFVCALIVPFPIM
jgi:hypothetical protein